MVALECRKYHKRGKSIYFFLESEKIIWIFRSEGIVLEEELLFCKIMQKSLKEGLKITRNLFKTVKNCRFTFIFSSRVRVQFKRSRISSELVFESVLSDREKQYFFNP